MRSIKILFLLVLFAACDKVDPIVPSNNPLSNGAIVLCEGLFQQNNAQLSFINFSDAQVENNFFLNRVGRQLGDTGNDIKRYGSKIYILVNVSSTIEIVDAHDFSSIKQINMMNGTTAKQPRSIVFHEGAAYVTCFDGYVDRIDTTTLNITERIPVGANPEGLAIANGKLYVANSGGLNSSSMDSTVSVIDLSTLEEIDRVTVGLNPGGIKSDVNGAIYVITRGNYGSIPSRMVRIESQTDQVSEEFDFDISSFSEFNGHFLFTKHNFSSGESSVGIFNTTTQTVQEEAFISLNQVQTLYGVTYNPINNKIYLSDAMNYTNTGYIHEYSSSGLFIQSFHVGLNPSKLLFYD